MYLSTGDVVQPLQLLYTMVCKLAENAKAMGSGQWHFLAARVHRSSCIVARETASRCTVVRMLLVVRPGAPSSVLAPADSILNTWNSLGLWQSARRNGVRRR